MKLIDWINLFGVLVSVIGFALAIWQLVRTARATEATRKAVERTERRMALNHLLVLLPQFRLLESDLDHAASEDDRGLARRALVSYSHFAGEVATILSGQDDSDKTLIVDLQNSARQASLTKATLIDAPTSRHTKQLTKDFRERLSELSLHVGSLATTFQVKSEK